ncbi:CST complex subunit STN1 isoform 1-T2 [Clarias gariepinus]|uniref:CST complex subunit STN1 n=1 Tax=Clarias gariepinus TaxID=13013 RepID=UPI00234CE7CC|nr:CST complex subunit STN1 [Clarias gariepinus]XP_053333217.1 CST complex subunit STN1 [Clarias gariepinus]
MDGDQGSTEDEPPSLYWGLDPVFSAYARLYVKDILQMKESRQVPGIYFYKSHPLFQVDVLGTVVYKRERDDFYCYGVDDSTGVINCLCWKDEKWRDRGESVKAAVKGTAGGGFNIEEQLRKLREAQRSSSVLEIGDLLRVRGSLKTSREQREIMASSFYKVNDPVMSEQISRMLEMPQLYRDCYDKPFRVPSNELHSSSADNGTPSSFQSVLGQSVYILKEFLKEKEVTRFRPYDVEYLLHPLIQQPKPSTSAEQEPGSVRSTIPAQIRNLLKETLKILQVEGEIFRKVLSQDEVYNVTEHDKDLLAAICDILRVDCKREKYAEKGCHVLHILSSVRQRYSCNLSREALHIALKFLECNSDIISTTDSHYTIL